MEQKLAKKKSKITASIQTYYEERATAEHEEWVEAAVMRRLETAAKAYVKEVFPQSYLGIDH